MASVSNDAVSPNTILFVVIFFALLYFGSQFYIERKHRQCIASCAAEGLEGYYRPPWSGGPRGAGRPGHCTCTKDVP